jgi:integrase/recombinase XerD
MTITKDLIEQFKQYVFSHSSEDTALSYSAEVRQFSLGRDVAVVNAPQFFFDLMLRTKNKGLALETISKYVAAHKKFLRFMEQFHGLKLFNLDNIKCKHPGKREVNYLEKHEVERIRSLPVNGWSERLDRALFEFYLNTGCRVSEGVSLDREHLKSGEVEVLGKGNKVRSVFLGDSAVPIQRYLDRRTDDNMALFINQYGERLRRFNVFKRIRALGERAGLNRPIHPHLLRATFCTYLIRAGTDPKTVQELMGHEDLETTLRYYYAVTKEGMKEAHQRLQQYLQTPSG